MRTVSNGKPRQASGNARRGGAQSERAAASAHRVRRRPFAGGLLPALAALAACGAVLAPVPASPQAADPGAPAAVRPVAAPELVDLVRQTVTLHPEVLAALAALDASRALQSAAERPLYNPEISANIETFEHDVRRIGVDQTLDIGGRRGARATVSAHDRERAAALLQAVRRRLAGEFLALLGDYWTAASLDELAETRIGLMGSFAELTRQRRQAGDLTQVDLNAANLAYAQAEMAHATAESAITGADQALRAVVPFPAPPAWPALPADLQAVAVDESALEDMLAALPEVRVSEAELARAAALVDLRDRERRAEPTLGLEVGRDDDDTLIAVNFTMPINVRNRFVHEVAAARAERTLAERAAENTRIRARRRALAAGERYRLTREAWMAWQSTGEPNLRQQTELLERLVDAGELSTTDYLVQLNQTLDTAMNALELRREFWRAWFEWLDASGQIDSWLGIDMRQ